MSFYDKICNLDIMNIIFKLCDSIDSKTALVCTSKYLYKILRSKAYFALHQDNLRLELTFQTIVKINCIDNECDDICACIGQTTFIYANEQQQRVADKATITRYIPYCRKCTDKFVNFGDRSKPIIYGESNEYANFVFDYGFL